MLLCLFQTNALYGQHQQTTLDSVLNLLAGDEMFHGQVLMAEKGKVRFSKAYGLDQKTPISNKTPFNIQSVTKAFTAVSVLMLSDRNMLNLEDRLTDFFPGLPYPRVTLRHLLTMTSGLPRFLETALRFGDTTRVMSNPEILSLIAQHKPQAQTPGDAFNYNNSNYLLLASVIEKVSGKSYQEFVESSIFIPLGMHNSLVKVNDAIGGTINASNFYQPYGEGNIYSTAEDLFVFDQALKANKLLPKTLTFQLFSPYQLNSGEMSNFGFAWRIRTDNEQKKVRIVGDGPNTRAIWQSNLTSDRSIIYIHSHSVNYQEQVFEAVLNIWEGKPYKLPIKRIPYLIDTSLYKSYTGKYLSKVFGLLHITESGGKLFLRPDPVPGKEELIPSSDRTFFFANQPVEWEFFLNKEGKVIGMGFKGDRANMGLKQD